MNLLSTCELLKFLYKDKIVARKEANEFELILIQEDLKQKGITNYTIAPGNDCVWVWFRNQNWYYIFNEGRIADIVID